MHLWSGGHPISISLTDRHRSLRHALVGAAVRATMWRPWLFPAFGRDVATNHGRRCWRSGRAIQLMSSLRRTSRQKHFCDDAQARCRFPRAAARQIESSPRVPGSTGCKHPRGHACFSGVSPRKDTVLARWLAATGASALFVGMATASLGGPPWAAAGPDASCQDPVYTTAIVVPSGGPDFRREMVACVPVDVVDHHCHAPLGEPHMILYPLGQGPQPACRSIYDPH